MRRRLKRLVDRVVVGIVAVAAYCALGLTIDHHDLSEYVETHPCLARERVDSRAMTHLGVRTWTTGATAYECAAVAEMLWIDDPQPKSKYERTR